MFSLAFSSIQCRIAKFKFADEVRRQFNEHSLSRRRLFSPALSRDPLAQLCPSRLPKIKIQTRRLLSPFPLKDCRPLHRSLTSTPTPASSSPVESNSHLSPWRTTRRYVLAPHPRMCSPTPPRGLPLPLRPASPNTLPVNPRPHADFVSYSMSTPSRAPMPVPPPLTPCSVLL